MTNISLYSMAPIATSLLVLGVVENKSQKSRKFMKKWFVFLSKLLGRYLEYISKNNVHFSLQTSFVTLDEVIKTTNRRVNAIEHVIIPRYERTVRPHQNERVLKRYFRSII